MTSPALLAPLATLHALLRDLLGQVSPDDAMACPLPGQPSMAWAFARAVYRETYWLREQVAGADDLTARVRHLFEPGALPLDEQCRQLAPPAHLLAWAAEIQDEHLRRLATPGALPAHPLLADDRLPWLLLQENAKTYEQMLALRLALVLSRPAPRDYRVGRPLVAAPPRPRPVLVEQGHYRIGSRHDPFAYDNELPPQAVELSAYCIAARPVSNAEYLAFIDDGGYDDATLWPEPPPAEPGLQHPLHWRTDADGNWYGIGVNGPADLPPDEPVGGIGRPEAIAFAAWAARLGGATAGAVLQHEYQWEVAARAGLIEGTGRVWEWCANPLHPYPGFTAFPDASFSGLAFGGAVHTLKGASLHTQPCLRRASFRHWGAAGDRHRFTGARLVLPPG